MDSQAEARIRDLEQKVLDLERRLGSLPARIIPDGASSSLDPGPDYWVLMSVTGIIRWDIPRFVTPA